MVDDELIFISLDNPLDIKLYNYKTKKYYFINKSIILNI